MRHLPDLFKYGNESHVLMVVESTGASKYTWWKTSMKVHPLLPRPGQVAPLRDDVLERMLIYYGRGKTRETCAEEMGMLLGSRDFERHWMAAQMQFYVDYMGVPADAVARLFQAVRLRIALDNAVQNPKLALEAMKVDSKINITFNQKPAEVDRSTSRPVIHQALYERMQEHDERENRNVKETGTPEADAPEAG